MIVLEEYMDDRGRSLFARWLDALDKLAAAKVTIAVSRMVKGNFSNAKSVGQGVSELRIDFGPGYRVYFAMIGSTVVLLLGGGSKRGQQRDIQEAKRRWQDHKNRAGMER